MLLSLDEKMLVAMCFMSAEKSRQVQVHNCSGHTNYKHCMHCSEYFIEVAIHAGYYLNSGERFGKLNS